MSGVWPAKIRARPIRRNRQWKVGWLAIPIGPDEDWAGWGKVLWQIGWWALPPIGMGE